MSAYENQRFVQDPLKYARDVCINPQTRTGATGTAAFNPNLAYQTCHVDLVPWSTSLFSAATQVMLEPSANAGAGLISAYYVPYIAFGTISSNGQTPVLLDNVPTTGALHRFIFTGGQNGCTLLLLRGTSPNTVAALHYPNSDGRAHGYPLLAQVNRTAGDVLIEIHFDVYGETMNPNACSFFWHDGIEWVGVTQPQVQGAPDMGWGRCSMSINTAKGAKKISSRSVGVIT